jgi:hypothetical protein
MLMNAECNLKAVALKSSNRSMRPRETDAQGTAAGRVGEEHAMASGRAWADPGDPSL